MGETASSWRTPLHSSGSEAPDQKAREQKGRGGEFLIDRSERPFIGSPGDPTAGLVDHDVHDCNPFEGS